MAAVVAKTGAWRLEIVKRNDVPRFEVLPKRWIVERSFAWIVRCRRLARDFERHVRSVVAFMRMMVQGLAPGMEHGDEADLGAEMLRVGGDPAQRLGGGSEQDGVDRLLVLEGDLGHRCGQREHDVEVRRRQQLGLPGLEPCGTRLSLALRTVPVAAGVIGMTYEAAIGAELGVAAQRRRPAQRDGAHHPPLDAAQMTIVRAAIGVAVAAQDVRHF